MKTFTLFLILLGLSINLFSQNVEGYGTVMLQNGTKIPNAKINLSPLADTNTVYQFVSDKNGNYSFDIPQNGNNYRVTIIASHQSLQFETFVNTVSLISGIYNVLSHQVTATNTHGITISVSDENGNPVQYAIVKLYDTKNKWKIDSCSVAEAVYTDANGIVEINSLLSAEYWFNINKDYQTNRFTTYDTSIEIDTTQQTSIYVTIRDLTENEFYLSGLCDNKTWITDSMIIFGNSQPYDADSKLLSDGTWWDSNGNFGYWWFNAGETTMTYDYDSASTNGGGSQVEATNLVITDSTFIGDMDMSGLAVTYYMHAEYDTINLWLNAQDTILYIPQGETVTLLPSKLFINSSYCFTCNTTLSKTTFDINDGGNNEVVLTMTDRCGNSATDTINVEVVLYNNIEKAKTSEINIYPNPATNYFSVESNITSIDKLKIVNINGQMVKEIKANNYNDIQVNISDLKSGLYFIKIITDNYSITKKLIVN